MSQGEQRPALLLQRNFAALWWGQLISLLGDRLTYLALGGLLLQHTHRGSDEHYPVLLALLGNVMAAPVLLFSPFTGAWVDRMDLKRVLIVSDLLRAIVVLAVPWTYALTGHTGTTFVLVFLLFTCNVFFLPAKSAITPEIVPPGELLAANSLLSVAGIAATAIGALGGGWVVDHWGWSAAMQIDALTYLVSVGTIAAVRYRPAGRRATVVPESARHYLREVREGWATVRDNPHVGLGLTALAAVWIGGGFLHVAGNQHIQQVASVPGMERVGAGRAGHLVREHARPPLAASRPAGRRAHPGGPGAGRIRRHPPLRGVHDRGLPDRDLRGPRLRAHRDPAPGGHRAAAARPDLQPA